MGCQQTEMLMIHRPPTGTPEAFVASLKSDKALHGVVAVGIDDASLMQQFRSLSIPVVLLDSVQPANDALFDEVSHAGEPAVFDAISHLIRLGHEKVGLMQSLGLNSINIQRQYGYERALTTAGLPVRPEYIFPVAIDSEAAYARMRRILNSTEIPTAIFCTGDHLAIGVMAAIRDHGWKIPRGISVIGYGNEGYFISPSLSTIHIPIEQMGIQAIQLLAERLKHPTAPLKRVVLPTAWTPRGSCDCPRISTPPSVPPTQP
jgi:LacI family transcriptional regulator